MINCLAGREQRVVLNGEPSEWLSVDSGVPQGSVLGPILFIIYNNIFDIKILELLNILLKFADDTKMRKVVNSSEDSEVLQVEIAELWQMEYNVDNCKVMQFGGENKNSQIQ